MLMTILVTDFVIHLALLVRPASIRRELLQWNISVFFYKEPNVIQNDVKIVVLASGCIGVPIQFK